MKYKVDLVACIMSKRDYCWCRNSHALTMLAVEVACLLIKALTQCLSSAGTFMPDTIIRHAHYFQRAITVNAAWSTLWYSSMPCYNFIAQSLLTISCARLQMIDLYSWPTCAHMMLKWHMIRHTKSLDGGRARFTARLSMLNTYTTAVLTQYFCERACMTDFKIR